MTVNKERIRKLVGALRSDEYQQGSGRLATIYGDETRYCCLGVACLVAMNDGVEVVEEQNPLGPTVQYISFDDEAGFMPAKVFQYFGFDGPDPLLKVIDRVSTPDGSDHARATYINDNIGYDFHKIADCFERTYLTDEPE